VTLTSTTPAPGSYFAGWSGGGCSGAGSCVVTLTADTAVNATYSTTSFTFSDDPLTAGQTVVRVTHILELRSAISTLRSNNGLPPFIYTDPVLSPGATEIKAVHITELRAALDAVYVQRARPLPMYTDPAITPGAFTVKAAHVADLRLAVRLIE
jgi:hypothetical protein